MATAPIEYEGFEPTGDAYNFYLIMSTTSSTSKRKADGDVNIPCYFGVTKQGSGTTPTDFDTSQTFCRLVLPWKDDKGKDKEQIAFCLLEVLSSRCQKLGVRKKDYDAVKNGWTSLTSPFKLWMKSGKFLDPGKETVALTVAPTPSQSFADWDREQLERWEKLTKAASKKLPDSDWPDVQMRFKELPDDGKYPEIYFSPNHPAVHGIDLDALEDLVNGTLGEHTYPVIDFSIAASGKSLRCVGSHPFSLYHIWMKAKDFEELWKYNLDGKTKLPVGETDLPRPFPSNDAASVKPFKEVNDKMKLKGIRDTADEAPSIRVSYEKLAGARYAVRSDYKDQTQVWGMGPNDVCHDHPSFKFLYLHFSGSRKGLDGG